MGAVVCWVCGLDIVHSVELMTRGARTMHRSCYPKLLRRESDRLVAKSRLLRAEVRQILELAHVG